MDRERNSFLKRVLLNLEFTLNEFVRLVDPSGLTDDDLTHLHKNLADVFVYDWFGLLVTHVPNSCEILGEHRVLVFRAYFYGCDPLIVAEALAEGEHPVRYCFRYKKGLMATCVS